MQSKKNILFLLSSLCFASLLIQACKDDKDALKRYYEMLQQPCVVEALAGNQPQTVCDVIDRLKFYEKYLCKFSNAILLYGPPGTGKTMLAKAIAKIANAIFKPIAGSTIVTVWQASGTKKIQELYKEATDLTEKGQTVVIFIDEGDAISKDRDRTHNDDVSNSLNQLLVEISNHKDNPQLLTIIATNKIESFDPALRSRLQEIEIALPDKEQCRKIFEHYLDGVDNSDRFQQHMQKFVKTAQKNEFSGRDIEEIVQKALYHAEKIESEHILIQSIEDQIELMKKKKKKEKNDKEELEKKYQPKRTRWDTARDVSTISANVASIGYNIVGAMNNWPTKSASDKANNGSIECEKDNNASK